jgi:hypothetical protein
MASTNTTSMMVKPLVLFGTFMDVTHPLKNRMVSYIAYDYIHCWGQSAIAFSGCTHEEHSDRTTDDGAVGVRWLLFSHSGQAAVLASEDVLGLVGFEGFTRQFGERGLTSRIGVEGVGGSARVEAIEIRLPRTQFVTVERRARCVRVH